MSDYDGENDIRLGKSDESNNSLYVTFKAFRESECSTTMFAFSCLYFTVLSFGGLMTVYVRSMGFSDSVLGISRGLSAVTGFLGASIFPFFLKCFDIYTTGLIAIVYLTLLVNMAASSFMVFPKDICVWVLIIVVIMSRIGLWMFDLCVRQIAQETVKSNVRGRVNSLWKSMCSFFEMSSYGAALIFNRPKDFPILTTLSAIMVTTCMVLYVMEFRKLSSNSRYKNDGSDEEQSALVEETSGGSYKSTN